MERPKYVSITYIDNTTVKIEKGEIEELNSESYYNIPNEEIFVREEETYKYVAEITKDTNLSLFKDNKWIIEIEYWPDGTKVFVIDEESQAILFSDTSILNLIADKIIPYVSNANNTIT